MSSPSDQPSLILIQRLADGTVEWIPLERPERIRAVPDGAYTLITRADYEVPQTLVVHRRGDDLILAVQATEVVMIEGFFGIADVAFHPTPDIAGGAGPFSGAALTPDSPLIADSPDGRQVLWSNRGDAAEDPQLAARGDREDSSAFGGGSPLLWGGLGLGGLGLVAVAAGGGGGGSSGPVPVTFTSGASAPAVDEKSGAGQVIYTAAATADGAVTYSLAPGGDADAFTINASTGEVTLLEDPNFATQSSFSFTVVATDNSGSSSQRTVSLAVNDVTPPDFTSGNTADPIDEGSGADQVVYTAEATDAGTVRFSLAESGDWQAFTIDSATGVVTLNDDPDFFTQSSFNFTVVATDNAGNASEQPVTLGINVVADTSIVVFDLVSGTSSDHSDRSFQEDVPYVIYIRVESESATLNTGGSDAGTWGTWSGASNLGSDDRIVLVGTDGDVLGRGGDAVESVFTRGNALFWNTTDATPLLAGAALVLFQDGEVLRFTEGGFGIVDLWVGNWDANPNAGASFNQDIYLLAMPERILTSQGLA